MNYRQDIDGLRALAVLLVIVFHAFPKLLPNGFLGVDIFFVISGFLITSIILNNLVKGKFSFINFYIRRVKRILPPALIVLFFVSLVGALTLFDEEFEKLRLHIKAASAFYINFQLLKEAGYFDSSSLYKPLLHYWSLAIEEQFYLVWPILLFFMFSSIRYFQSRFKFQKDVTVFILSIFTLTLLGCSFVFFLSDSSNLYYSSLVRAWELLVGCFTAICYFEVNRRALIRTSLDKISNEITALAIIGIFVSLAVASKPIATVISVLAAAFYLLSKDDIKIKLFFKTKPMVLIGLMSYSLYLWHWPVLSFYRIYKPAVAEIETVGLVLLGFGFSYITYLFVEKPLKLESWDAAFDGLKIKLDKSSMVRIASCVLSVLFLYKAKLLKLPDREFNKLDWTEEKHFPHNSECLLSGEKLNVAWCLNEIEKKKIDGLIFGDSHARSLYVGFLGSEDNVRWQLVAHHSCPPYAMSGTVDLCRDMVEKTNDNLKKNDSIKFVVYVMAQRVFKQYSEQLKDKTVDENIIKNLKGYSDRGKEIVIVKPVPEIANNIYICSKRRLFFDSTDECRIKFSDWMAESQDYQIFAQQIRNQIPKAIVVDPSEEICDGSFCYAAQNGQTYYVDKDHLSYFGSRMLAKKIQEKLKTIY